MRDDAIHDDALFDRLVDGELTAGERHGLLASLDERPDGWRRCALAFLEAQTWREGLQPIAQGAAEKKAGDTRDLPTPVSARQRALKSGLAWLSIAASVLLAFTLGTMNRNRGLPIAQVEPTPGEQLANASPSPPAMNAGDVVTLWARDDMGQPRSLRVPLVDAGALDRQLGMQFQPALPATMRERLQQRGYDVRSKRRYAPLWLENGRPMIVPVEDTKIVPVRQSL